MASRHSLVFASALAFAGAIGCADDDATSDGSGGGGGGGGGGGSSGTAMCGATYTRPVATLGTNGMEVGTRAWENPVNVVAGEPGRAELKAFLPGEVSHYLVISQFTVDLPTTATIQGIEVSWTRRSLLYAGTLDAEVRLSKAGVPTTANRASVDPWDDEAVVTYGGPTDLWGTTWLATDILAGFSVMLSVENAGETNDAIEVDDAVVTVYFTNPC